MCCAPTGGFRAGDTLDVVKRRLAVVRDFDDIALATRGFAQSQELEGDAELAQQFLPARAAGGEIEIREGHDRIT